MKTTLWNILNNNVENLNLSRGIEIPMIQRDYAQGRDNSKAREIREVFLADLHKSILEVKLGLGNSLDLDFVFGISDNHVFVPLDGQQRLTTLYLIHWYLAFRDQSIDRYKIPLSKFTYEIRPSSSLFLKKLLDSLNEIDYKDLFQNGKSFEKTIKNKNWYFVAWNHDITVQAMIIMLDAIHHTFKFSEVLFEDLIDLQRPPITFNFLQISNFGLSDRLYVKMNSRGKPLTSFENLKAELGKFIKESDFNDSHNYTLRSGSFSKRVDVETYFMTKIDNDWSDFFWKLRDDQKIFDDKLLHLLSFIAFNELTHLQKDVFDESMETFSSSNFQISYHSLLKLGLINEKSILSYIDILDLLSIQNGVFKEFLDKSEFYHNTVLPILSKKMNAEYETRVLFYGIFSYVLRNKPSLNLDELNRWSRLLHNLTRNTIYNRSKDLVDSIHGIDRFLDTYCGNIYLDFFNNSIQGFDTVQTKEEHVKVFLRISQKAFNLFIDKIENQGYLSGQIIGLLIISGIVSRYDSDKLILLSPAEAEILLHDLNDAYCKFLKYFDDKGLIPFDDEIFRRALLTFGDYAIYSTNFSFLINNHRDVSWKRLLKELATTSTTYAEARNAFLRLFEVISVDKEATGELKGIIKDFLNNYQDVIDWKYYFIKYPIILNRAELKYVKFFDGDHIYPLRKTKYFREADPEYMILVLQQLLVESEIDVSSLEFGFLQSGIEQYGVKRINGKSVKIAYNHNRLEPLRFYIKIHGEDGFYIEGVEAVASFVKEHCF